MLKHGNRDDSSNMHTLRDLLADEKAEQSATASKIEGWLRLADRALGNEQRRSDSVTGLK
jgi:hypothetical protein